MAEQSSDLERLIYVKKKEGTTIVGFDGEPTSLTIPEEIDGTPVTVAELIGGTGVLLVFNNRFDGILQLMSRTIV